MMAGYQNQDPEWQPGADFIVYQSEQNGKWQIVTSNSDGSGRITLTGPQVARGEPEAQNVSPTWSPMKIHRLSRSHRGGRWALWTMNPDGSGIKGTFGHRADRLPLRSGAGCELGTQPVSRRNTACVAK